jgi:hypothetical protein
MRDAFLPASWASGYVSRKRTAARSMMGAERVGGGDQRAKVRRAGRGQSSLLRRGGRRAAVDEGADAGVDSNVRFDRVPFRKKQVERVDAIWGEAELRGAGIEVHLIRLRLVHATEVDDELVIEEDEDIVITFEREDFPAAVDEPGMDFDGEVEIVVSTLIAET